MHRPIVFADAQNATVSFATPNLKKKSPRRRLLPRKHQPRKPRQQWTQAIRRTRSPRRRLLPKKLQPRKLLPRRLNQNKKNLKRLHQWWKWLLPRPHQLLKLLRRPHQLQSPKHHDQSHNVLPHPVKVA